MRRQQAGFAALQIFLVVMVVGMIGGVGWYVYKSQHQSIASLQQTQKATEPTNFAECVRAGGDVDSLPTPPGFPDDGTDPSADGLLCRTVVNHKFSGKSFRGSSALDNRCKDLDTCNAIKQAAQAVCTKQHIHWTDPALENAQLPPVFRYEPVVQDNFAKLQLVQCGSIYYSGAASRTVFLQKIHDVWLIFKVLDIQSTCEDVDGAGIPLELLYACGEPGVGFRAPKVDIISR